LPFGRVQNIRPAASQRLDPELGDREPQACRQDDPFGQQVAPHQPVGLFSNGGRQAGMGNLATDVEVWKEDLTARNRVPVVANDAVPPSSYTS
jgi:hypothetical protein